MRLGRRQIGTQMDSKIEEVQPRWRAFRHAIEGTATPENAFHFILWISARKPEFLAETKQTPDEFTRAIRTSEGADSWTAFLIRRGEELRSARVE